MFLKFLITFCLLSQSSCFIFPINKVQPVNQIVSQNIFDDTKKIIGKKIVIGASSFLPNFDTIGHNFLHANNNFIHYLLTHDVLNDTLKKKLILLSIHIAQNGDNMGSFLLQVYYNIVNSSL